MTAPPTRGLGIIIYGIPGIGKTHFSLFFPGPLLCISILEPGGFRELKQISDEFSHDVPDHCTGIEVEKFMNLYGSLQQVLQQPYYKTVVIDSLSGFQQIFFEHLINSNIPQTKTQTYKEAEQTFFAFYNGPRVQAPSALAPFLSVLSSLLNAGVNVILIGHKRNSNEENVSGPNYRKADIDMDEGLRNAITKWCPHVLYMDLQPSPTEVLASTGYGQNKEATKVKTGYSSNKLIYTTTNPQNSAKNKLKLPELIPIGASAQETFDNFWKYVPNCYKPVNP